MRGQCKKCKKNADFKLVNTFYGINKFECLECGNKQIGGVNDSKI